MRTIPPESTGRLRFGESRCFLRGLLLWMCLLLVLGVGSARALGGDSGATAVLISAAQGGGVGQPFAIADFDGDQRPDFASVQDRRGNSSSTDDYWIHFRLSGSGWSSIRLVGPRGGLLIQARDVNGDRAVDLVLASAWLKQPVAILVNDGHGGFSSVEPAAFPAAFSAPKSEWTGAGGSNGVMNLPQRTRVGSSGPSGAAEAQAVANSSGRLAPELFVASIPATYAGRAPPLHSL